MATNAQRISLAQSKLGSDIASMAKAELFGLKPCRVSWSNILARQSIIDVYNCSGFQYLSNDQSACLLGKMTEDLTTNCC
jgi:hypothetical protein